MRYIGGKSLLADNIFKIILNYTSSAKTILDIFAGSGAISTYLKKNNYHIFSNDILYFSYVLQYASVIINEKPTFSKLNILNPISYLNNITIGNTDFSKDMCFIYNNYSLYNSNRMYFQEKNALKIDLIRLTIEKWKRDKLISQDEYFYLLACLINAVPYISNITGIYSSYLKFWDKRTYNDLKLKEIEINNNNKFIHQCFNEDYTKLLDMQCDVLYADPPYNEREYLPNYHILETIARYDCPKIHGVTGMRDYSYEKSPFCKKRLAESAFEKLIKETKCRYILISYNNEGIISTSKLSELCQSYAVDNSFKLFEFPYRRYKNKIPNNSVGLKEQLYLLKKF